MYMYQASRYIVQHFQNKPATAGVRRLLDYLLPVTMVIVISVQQTSHIPSQPPTLPVADAYFKQFETTVVSVMPIMNKCY